MHFAIWARWMLCKKGSCINHEDMAGGGGFTNCPYYRKVANRSLTRILTWIESSFEHIHSKLRGYQMKCVISFILLVIKSKNSSPTPATDENWPKLTCTNTKQISFYIIECFQNFQQKIESWLEYSPDSITVLSQNAKF